MTLSAREALALDKMFDLKPKPAEPSKTPNNTVTSKASEKVAP